MSEHHYLACDLGAESGRLMAGHLVDGILRLEEIHRFANTPIQLGTSLRWNMASLRAHLEAGLVKAAQGGHTYQSISCDSWGVDYVLLDATHNPIEPTFHYRDPRTEKGVKQILERLSWETIFSESGIQFMPLNALFQLGAESPERLSKAACLLGIGDYFNHWLGGRPVSEVSMASTFQLYNPLLREWSKPLVKAAGLREEQLAPLVPSGTVIGSLSSSLMDQTGLQPMKVVASCSHDTGAAVAAVPATGNGWAYLSSGTWSLMGVEWDTPILSETCRELNYTNEVGHGHCIRLLKNISGMWLLQECRRAWEAEGISLSYDELMDMADGASPFQSLIQPADPRFLAPGDMPRRIEAYCKETGQEPPADRAATVRCILESLALLYRRSLCDIETIAGHPTQILHIVGGGSQNRLLNQWTANALNREVIAGPVEATAAGNLMIQAMALGHVSSLAEARGIISRSFPLERSLPQPTPAWQAAWERFKQLPEAR